MSNVTVNKGSFDKNRSSGYKRIGQSERVVSLVAGTALAASALRSRSLLSSMLLLGASAGLIHRGSTGKCGFSKGINKLNCMLNEGLDKVSHLTQDRLDSINDSKSRSNEVDEASDESFPASDAPSFTPVTGEANNSKTHMNK